MKLPTLKKEHYKEYILVALITVVGMVFLLAFSGNAKADVYCAVCIVGEQGEKGDRGPRGPRGYTGATGETGPQGEAGLAGADGRDGKDALNDDDYWTDDELDEMFAATTAMAGLDFTNTTNKLQLGAALGGYGSESQGAVGIGKVLDNDSFGDILLSFKTTLKEVGRDGNEKRPWVAAATWKVKLD